jgi:two-component system sensor kinase FixL
MYSAKFREERRLLQKEILEISGREQQRTGQDLLDDVCQQLTDITLITYFNKAKISKKRLPEAAAAGEIHKLVVKAIVQTRQLAKGLLPVEIPANGLLTALEDMAATTERMAHVACRATGATPFSIRDGAVVVHLYRIAQEAVANAVKHARPRHIVIGLSERNSHIRLTITDDGCGVAHGALDKGGLGMSIMYSRAETISGTLHIRSSPNRGTSVVCSLPSPAAPAVKPIQPYRPIPIKERHG